ncbi:MAG TPA: UDP-N-acetylmuramoyl-L-alanine--D-glutamate ligase [Candidatus Methylomirabilis sp.]|nr:UDP-N-acetylmuramoyl-L-alanine--D-glutamate ligase [Candidatus Methylomirabilis sp.]
MSLGPRKNVADLDLRGMRVTVVGLARSGYAACKVLSERGASVLATDASPAESLRVDVAELSRRGVRLETGGHRPESFLEADLIILSPGVDLRLPPLAQAFRRGIPVWSEVELAYRLTAARFIGVTGTKGKGTTATLIGDILQRAGREVVVAGNIGRPLCDVGPDLPGDAWVVAELSSFQLETIVSFRPHVAVLLNLAPDHLDRYATLSDYYAAKARIFQGQGSEDFAVLNADDPLVLEYAQGIHACIRLFSRMKAVGDGAFKSQDRLLLRRNGRTQSICQVSAIRARGGHMLEDALAACAAAGVLGVDPKPMAEAMEAFGGRPHCMEMVAEIGGIRYVNDSKATNVFAVRRALEGWAEPVILIMGGRDKREDFRPLTAVLQSRAKAVIAMGEAREKILEAIGDCCPTERAEGMADAVTKASQRAIRGDTVLLSPGCTSFDMFRNAEDRGNAFRRVVHELQARGERIERLG